MDLCFTISAEFSGLRLDQALSARIPDCSRSRASNLIQKGRILVDGQPRRPGYKVKQGQSVSGALPGPDSQIPQPQPISLSILHEDDEIMVIDKPAGMVVHPGPGHRTGTLVNGLLAHDTLFQARGWDPERPGIVHRLDRDTSGLILIAKSGSSLGFLQREFKQRRVEKTYLALVQGENIPDRGEIVKPIGRHPKKRKMMAVVPETGKYARTGFEVRQRFTGAALMAVRLYTGRTHQIRVHFYDQGMPLLGDTVYQLRRRRKGTGPAPRQMLHSWRLGFRHPYSGLKFEFEAPMPKDFTSVMKTLADPAQGE